MNHKIASCVRAHVPPGSRVVVAVSGGKDSMALLHAMTHLDLPLSVAAAHFNHQLRGEESLRDQRFVEEFCASAGIPLFLGRDDVGGYAASQGMGIEEAARTKRYQFLSALACDWIVTAHTAEDNLETLLMHLIRGTGQSGLGGIPPVRGNILRPMLCVTRQEVDAYLQRHRIPHVEDSSNGQDEYLRNRIRHHVLPLLLRENPNLPLSAWQLCQTLRQEDSYLEREAQSALKRLTAQGPLDLAGLYALDPALQARVMRQFLAPVPGLERVHVTSALALGRSDSPSAVLNLPGKKRLRRVYGALELTDDLPGVPSPGPQPILPGQRLRFGPWQVRCDEEVYRGPQTGVLALLASAVQTPLTLRCRRPGDRIQLPGGSKKLSRLMIDEKIPAHWRDTMPVVCSGDTIAGLLTGTAAAFCRPEPGRDCILLSAIRMEE